MDGERAKEEDGVEDCFSLREVKEVPLGLHPHAERDAFGVGAVDFSPCGRREDVHEEVGRGEDAAADDVDEEMQPEVGGLGGVAGAEVEDCVGEAGAGEGVGEERDEEDGEHEGEDGVDFGDAVPAVGGVERP